MNDGLAPAILKQLQTWYTVDDYPDTLAKRIADAVRAHFAALPPSEEEIEAGRIAFQDAWNDFTSDTDCHPDWIVRHHGRQIGLDVDRGDFDSFMRAALLASRAVLVPPPEDAR